MLIVLLLATVMQLSLSARTWLPTLDTNEFPIYPKNLITTFLQKDSEGGRFAVWRDEHDPYIMAANASNIYKTNDIHGYEVCSNRTMSIFLNRHHFTDSLNFRLLGLVNVKYIIVGKRTVTSPNLQWLYSADSLTIYENLLCKPHAYFAYRSIIVNSDDSATQEMLRPDFDGSEALFTKEDAPHDLGVYSQGENTVHVDKSENEEVVITAETDSKGIFILTDTYYPGWKCYVNGLEQSIYRVNYCMRGILLDAGKSQIVFKFEPAIFTVGASISGAAFLLLIVSFVFLRFKQKQHST